jgi:hypothetical protein
LGVEPENMALPPITVQLSKFEQLEILRLEIDAREDELRELEAKLKAILYDVEKRRYLLSIHGFFQEVEPHPEMVNYQNLAQRRDILGQAIETLKSHLTALEAETGTTGAARPALRPAAGPPPAPGAPRKRFDSFDDFRTSRSGG